MALDSDKNLGGVGALLIAIGFFVPFLGIVGIILVLIAMMHLADHYQDRSISRDAIYGLIFGIIGIVALGILLILLIFASAITSVTTFTMPMAGPAAVLSAIGILILMIVLAFVFYLLEAIYFKRAFDNLATKSGEGMFRTAGLLLLIGAVLTIIVVGLVLLFIAWILFAIAFFSIKEQPVAPVVPRAVIPPPLPSPVSNKFCPNCGAQNSTDATFCVRCGNKL